MATQKVMKQVMHQVPMQCTYITTEAMTTAHVQVLNHVFQAARLHRWEYSSKSLTINFRPSSWNYICKFGTVYIGTSK